MSFHRANGLVVTALSVMTLLGGCEYGGVGLVIIDEFLPSCREVHREVLLVLPSGTQSEEALSRMLVQAQSEGWHTTGGPGAAAAIGDRYQYSRTLSLTLDASTHSGEVMSARKKFWVDTNRHTGRFTTLFGPYYSADHDDNRHSVTGSIYAKGIWQALYNEAYRHAQSQGYSTDSISVSFDYPVMWEIICPATNATASRGVVEPCGHKSLIETKMYGPEFLAQMPITLHWVERSWE